MVLKVSGPDGQQGYVEIEKAPGRWGPNGKIKRGLSHLLQSSDIEHITPSPTETILTVTTQGVRYHGKMLTDIRLLEYIAKSVRVIEAPLSKMIHVRSMEGIFICDLPLE